MGTAAGRSALFPRRAPDGPQLRPGSLLSGGGMEEVPSRDPGAGRASETPGCFTLVLVATRRETPLFRHWRKCRMLSLAKGWRKRYRWFGSPVAYSKARTIAGIRSKQTEPGRQYRGLESHPARTVPRLSARKPAKSGIFSRECRFYLGGSGGHPRAPFPGKRWPPAAPRD